MASIFSNLFGGSSNKGKPEEKKRIFPPDHFSVLQTEIDGKSVLGSMNQAYKNYDQKAEYRWLLHIEVALEQANLLEDGLPGNDEMAVANQLEEELLAGIRAVATAHYVGHMFFDGFLDVYVYVDAAKETHDFLQSQVNKDGLLRPFSYEINEDAEWVGVSKFML